MNRAVLYLLRGYQKYLSALKPTPTCRFVPSCSQYAIEAVQRRGVARGLAMALWRLLRCNPLFKSGYDPVTTRAYHRCAKGALPSGHGVVSSGSAKAD